MNSRGDVSTAAGVGRSIPLQEPEPEPACECQCMLPRCQRHHVTDSRPTAHDPQLRRAPRLLGVRSKKPGKKGAPVVVGETKQDGGRGHG
jgi:hypothetical protein